MSKKDKFAGITAGLSEALDKIQPPATPAAPKTAPGQLMAFRNEMAGYEEKIAALEAKVKDLETIALPIKAIAPNPWQPRRVFDEREIEKLADSIAEVGLIQAIVVRRVPNLDTPSAGVTAEKSVPILDTRYQLVAGERRWRAHRMLEKVDIKAVVIEVSDADMALMALAENLDRQDLTDFEISRAIHRAQSEFPSKKKLAEACGIVRTDLYKYLAFANLPQFIQDDLEKDPGLLGRAAAEAIASVARKYGDKVPLAVEKVWARIKAGTLDQGKAAEVIEAIVQKGEHGAQPTTGRDIKKLFVGKEQAGSITKDAKGLSIKLKAAALSPEKETRLREFVEGLLKP